MALPSPGVLKTEISQLGAHKQEMLSAREGLLANLKELQIRKRDLAAARQEIYNQLDNPQLPDEVKPQLLERVSMLKNANISLGEQISSTRERLEMIERSVKGIENGTEIRRNVLSKLTGALAKQQATQTNKEVGRIKG